MSAPTYTCRPEPRGFAQLLRELLEFRPLLYAFVRRDLRLRYRHTWLGAGWNLLQPVAQTLVFAFLIGILSRGADDADSPRPLFLYSGILVWQVFARGISLGGTSLSSFRSLATQVYFPRLLLPLAAVLGAAVDFAVATSVLVALLVSYGAWPGARLLLAPLFAMLALLLSLGCSLLFAVVDVQFRDLRQAVPFLLQLGMLASPVVYPLAAVPERLQPFWALNPLAGVLEGFRYAVVPGAPAPGLALVATSVAAALALLFGALALFREREATLVDGV